MKRIFIGLALLAISFGSFIWAAPRAQQDQLSDPLAIALVFVVTLSMGAGIFTLDPSLTSPFDSEIEDRTEGNRR